MEFSINAEQLQPQNNSSLLFVYCKESKPEQHLANTLLTQLQQQQKDFIATHTVKDEFLQALAVVNIDKDDYASIQKLAQKLPAGPKSNHHSI